MQLDGYIRVSQVAGREGESFISPDVQREKIKAWAKLKSAEIINWEQDLDVSGGKLKRPGLDKIMERIRAKQTGGIAIATLDRFSRAGVGDALALIEEIKDADAVFGCIEPSIDTSDPVMGEFVLTIFLALGRMERLRLGAKWGDAKAQAIDRGMFITNTTPFGYRQRDDGRLEVDPVTKPIAEEIFARRAAGESLYSITKWLHTTGTTPPRHRRGRRAKDKRSRSERDRIAAAGRPWTRGMVLGTLKKREYLGEVHSGEFVKGGAHPPIIDPVTWQAAQRTATHPRWQESGDPALLLAGLVRCAGCRYTTASRHRIGKRVRPAYVCKRKGDGPGMCPSPVTIDAVTRAAVEDVPEGYCQCGCGEKTPPAKVTGRGNTKGSPSRCIRGHNVNRNIVGLHEFVVAEMWRHLYEIEANGYGADDGLEELKAALKTAREVEVEWSTDEDIAESTSREAFLAGAEVRRTKTKRIEAELAEATRKASRPLLDKPVRTARDEFENEMSHEDRRQFMVGMIQAVFVRQSKGGLGYGASADRVHIVWFDDPEPDVPRQGRRDYVQSPFVFPNDSDDPSDVAVSVA